VRPRAGATSEGTIAQTLADYAVKLCYEDLPADVVRTVKRTIIDTIGCAIGGLRGRPEPDRPQARPQCQRDARRERLLRRLQDEPRPRRVRQWRDDPLSRFQTTATSRPRGPAAIPATRLRRSLPRPRSQAAAAATSSSRTALAYEAFCKLADVLDTRSIGLDQVDHPRAPPPSSAPAG